MEVYGIYSAREKLPKPHHTPPSLPTPLLFFIFIQWEFSLYPDSQPCLTGYPSPTCFALALRTSFFHNSFYLFLLLLSPHHGAP